MIKIEDIALVNRAKPDTKPQNTGGALLWETCMRYVMFLHKDSLMQLTLNSRDEVVIGWDAIRLATEIVCGLQSKVPGEPEVFGQFKALMKTHQQSPWRPVLEKINIHSKRIRSKHLEGIGQQTYGSMLYKILKNKKNLSVHMIGSGQFAASLLSSLAKLPYLIHLHARNKVTMHSLVQEYKNIIPENSPHIASVLVIAAPISTQELVENYSIDGNTLIIDLRGQSLEDPIMGFEVVNLQYFVQLMNHNKRIASQVIQSARESILSRITREQERVTVQRRQKVA